MSYLKSTTISGDDSKGKFQVSTRNGHWNKEACINVAKKMDIQEPISVTHATNDLSGRGRGGRDVYKLNFDGSIIQTKEDSWGGGKRKGGF